MFLLQITFTKLTKYLLLAGYPDLVLSYAISLDRRTKLYAKHELGRGETRISKAELTYTFYRFFTGNNGHRTHVQTLQLRVQIQFA